MPTRQAARVPPQPCRCGEASLKSWGRDQRPQIPGPLVEEIADALVKEGKATCGGTTRGCVWRRRRRGAASPRAGCRRGAAEEEPVVVAGDAEPCRQCEDLQWKMRKLRRTTGFLRRSRLPWRASGAPSWRPRPPRRTKNSARSRPKPRSTTRPSASWCPISEAEPRSPGADLGRDLPRNDLRQSDRPPGSPPARRGPRRAPHPLPGSRPRPWRHRPLPPGAARRPLGGPSHRAQAARRGRTLAERGTRLQESALATVEGILTAPAGEALSLRSLHLPEWGAVYRRRGASRGHCSGARSPVAPQA